MATYSLSTYGIKVTTPFKVEVIKRDNLNVQETIDLTAQNAKISSDGTNFTIIGTGTDGDDEVNKVDPSDNDVLLTTGGEIQNIDGDDIDITANDAFAKKSGSDVEFSETGI